MTERAPKSRKPNRAEMGFLFAFHGVLTAAVLLTFMTGDDVMFLHEFAGYVALFAVVVRVMVGLAAPKRTPLAFSLPDVGAWVGALMTGRPVRGRNPLHAWMALILLAATFLAACSGVIGGDDLHEGLAYLLLLPVTGHAALVLLDKALKGAKGLRGAAISTDWGSVAETSARWAEGAARRTAASALEMADRIAEERKRRSGPAQTRPAPAEPPRPQTDRFGPKPRGLD